MRKILLIGGVFLTLVGSAQKNKVDLDSLTKSIVDRAFKDLTDTVNAIRNKPNMILSWPALNLVAAKTMSSYLSSSDDLSLNKAYGILDNSDGKLFIGGNLPFIKKSNKKLIGVLTIGTKSNIVDKLSEIYKKEKITNDISGEIKATFLLHNSLRFDKSKKQNANKMFVEDSLVQKSKMNLIRSKILQEDKMKARKELSDLFKMLDGMADTADARKIFDEKVAGLKDDLEDTFYEEEEAAFSKGKGKYSNSQKLVWLSFSGSIPISETKYSIAEDYKTNPHNVYYYPIGGSVRFTYLHDWFKVARYFVNVSYIVGKSNTLLDNEVDQSTITSTIVIDSSSVVNTTKKVYYSSYKQHLTDKLRGQFIVFPNPSKNKYIGIDVFGDLTLDTGDATWGVGIPVSLKDKDEKPLVNFEFILNKINQPKNRTFGISLSVPFSSLIY